MVEAELITGMRRELFRNVLVAPIVLLVRLPIALIYAILSGLVEALERLGDCGGDDGHGARGTDPADACE